MDRTVFEESSIAKTYIKLSLPLVFSMVITLIYNLADTFFVAQTNNTNLVAGVSLAAPVFTFFMALGNIFGQGGSSLISRLLGSGEQDGVRRVSSFCFYVTFFCGIAVAAVMLAFHEPILYLLGANEETYPYAWEYYLYLSIGAPAVLVNFIHSNLLRSEGLSKESMMGTVSGALVNIVLDPFLISVCGLGAKGAAIATVIGYIFTDVFFLFIVQKRSRILSLDIRKIGVSAQQLVQIFGIGVPAAFSNIMQSVSIILVNQFLLPYGNEQIAAMGIVLKVNMIALLILTGFTFGSQPLFGYLYGAGAKQKLRELLRFCLIFIGSAAVLLTVVVFVLAPVLMGCFMSNPQIIADGTVMLRWQVISMVFVGFVLLMTIVFQSFGKIAGSFVLSISRQGVIFLIILLIAASVGGYSGILVSQAIADVATALLAAGLFFRQVYPELRG